MQRQLRVLQWQRWPAWRGLGGVLEGSWRGLGFVALSGFAGPRRLALVLLVLGVGPTAEWREESRAMQGGAAEWRSGENGGAEL